MDFCFDLATPDDDAALRRLLAATAMPGSITVTFEREPNYFLGCSTMGHVCQVLVARHRPSGALAGMLCRATAPRYVNGQVEEVGYLTQLRVAEAFRNRVPLRAGLRLLQTCHADGRVRGYFAAIAEENPQLINALARPRRGGWLAFHLISHVETLGLIVGRSRPVRPAPGIIIEPGAPERLAEIVAFLRHEGARRQLCPVYTEDDFRDSGLTRDARLADLRLARRNGRLVGVAGLWDQAGYKQTIVRGYHGALHWLRPIVSLALRASGARPLPAPGHRIAAAYLSFLAVTGDDPAVFAALLDHLHNLAAERGLAYLMVGLDRRDPLLAVARRQRHITYRSRLYAIDLDTPGDTPDFGATLDDRLAYVEIAAL